MLNIISFCCYSDWFSNTYRKLLTVATTLFATSDPLRNLDHIIRKLDECAKVGGASEEHLSFMWLLTTKSFCNIVNEVMDYYYDCLIK